MAKLALSSKRLQINKANSSMIVFLAVATFLTVFSLVASKALISKYSYQSKVIGEKEKAANQLKDNIKAADELVNSYQAFTAQTTNVIGGSATGSGERDGDNAKIVLDALPSKYDFPALVSSLEKILSNKSFKLDSISGSDDEIAQAASTASPIPQPVPIPFEVSVTGNYVSIQDMINILERSIRPIQVETLKFSGTDQSMKLNLAATTYYLPEKNLNITTKEVR